MHRPGIEPGPPAWQASILPLNQRCLLRKREGVRDDFCLQNLSSYHGKKELFLPRGNKRNFGNTKKAEEKVCLASPTGNRTPVSRVTGGDTYHYTIEDWLVVQSPLPPD